MRFLTLIGLVFTYIDFSHHEGISTTVNCSSYLENLANSLANFTLCSIMHSRPIKLCEACIYSYIDILESYTNITELSDENGKCINNFVNLDRLEIVDTLYSNSYQLWNRAKCYECFESKNGHLTTNFSSETIHFNELLNNFESCLNRSDVNETNMCPTCMDKYIDLDNYYKSISDENEKIGVCMDIVDLMNGTRGFWSEKCCKFRQHHEYIFLGSIAGMIIIVIMFYALSKICIDKKMPKVLKQNRFAHIVNRPNSGR